MFKSKFMKTITVTLSITLFILVSFFSNAQEIKVDSSINNKITALQEQKQTVLSNEKYALSKEVSEIVKRFQENEISETEAEKQKIAAAEKHALNIDNKTAIIDNKIALLERNGNADDDAISFNVTLGSRSDSSNRISNHHRRTYSGAVIAVGLNNASIDGQSLNDSPYKVGGSRFFEIGQAWTTRVFKNAGWLRVKYGFSFQFNNLKLGDNKYLLDNGETTTIEEFPQPLDKAKLRINNLVFPVHFEFGPAKRIQKNDNTYFSSHNKFKIGVGGYAGFNLDTSQKLKYNKDGDQIKEKIDSNYNTNNFIYGLSGYIGFDSFSVYARYDLNPIFKTGVEQRNVSIGIRLDTD
jgi:hypothetical protein